MISAHIGVIGAGLIGGSICRTLSTAGYEHISVTSASQETRDEVTQAGFHVVATVQELVQVSDIVFVCVPLTIQMDVFDQILEAVNAAGKKGLIVTDVSSVKGDEARMATQKFSDAGIVFIPGHPMAGTEKSGFSASSDSLFAGATWVLCPPAGNGAEWLSIARLVLAMKAKLSLLTINQHDSAVASISHLPYVVAAALLHVLPSGDERSLALRLAAGSFRDGTRVAASEPWLSASMVNFNKENVASLLRETGEAITSLIAALEENDTSAVQNFFTEANVRRTEYESVKASHASHRHIFHGDSVTPECINECQRGALITYIAESGDSWTITFES